MRVQKYLSNLGYCSRRQAEELIKAGKVEINEKIVELGDKINPDKNELTVRGRKITAAPKLYIALNKPPGYVSSTNGRQGKSVLELVKDAAIAGKIYPVGRLDKDSSGLMILTNDGELANILTHPRYGHEKHYLVTLDRPLRQKDKKILQSGMDIGEKVKGIRVKKTDNEKMIELTLTEGKNRQIKKMLGRLGYGVRNLKRIKIANLELGDLSQGRWKKMQLKDIITNTKAYE